MEYIWYTPYLKVSGNLFVPFSFDKLAVHTKTLVSFWVVVLYQPEIEYVAMSLILSVLRPTTINMVNRKCKDVRIGFLMLPKRIGALRRVCARIVNENLQFDSLLVVSHVVSHIVLSVSGHSLLYTIKKYLSLRHTEGFVTRLFTGAIFMSCLNTS